MVQHVDKFSFVDDLQTIHVEVIYLIKSVNLESIFFPPQSTIKYQKYKMIPNITDMYNLQVAFSN